MGSVVIITARELDKDAGLITNGPGVVTRRQEHHFVSGEIFGRAIIHHDSKCSRKDQGDMR